MKKQTKLESFTEGLLNQIVGFLTMYVYQLIFFYFANVKIQASKHLGMAIGAIFVSWIKHYAIRRYMEWRKWK